jgi:outer membrane protein TolC
MCVSTAYQASPREAPLPTHIPLSLNTQPVRTIKDQELLIPRIMMLAILFLSPLSVKLAAQPLLLTEAYDLLEANYPTLQNAGLNDRILATELDILDLERKPSLYLKGSATLQSETTGFPSTEMLPISIDLPLYKFRTYGEVNHTLYDGGRLEARKKLKTAEGQLPNQQLELERFSLRKRINQLFLGVLLGRERVTIFETTLADITARKEAIAAAVELGAVLESELLQLRVREVEIKAQRDDVSGNILRLLANLGTLTGREISPDTELILPSLPSLDAIPDLNRPEFKLLDLQRDVLIANNDLIDASNKPVVVAFAQAGLGLPNPLNLFDSGIAPYAIGGVNFQWKFKDWGKSDKQRKLLEIKALQLTNNRETLSFNLNAGNDAYLADVARVQQQILRDEEIAGLQAEILVQMAAQLDNGVITASNYIIQANAELRARRQLNVHRAELSQLQLNFLNERGAF